MGKPKMRPPTPLFERIKLPLILVVYLALSEWADPFPFHVTWPARIAVGILILLGLREWHRARLEVDEEWEGKTTRAEERIRRQTSRVSKHTWLKIQRIAGWFVGAYVFGIILNALTDRCDSAAQCVVLAPRMAIENLPMALQFVLYMSLGMAQLGLMFYAMVKVGSYKVVMPGTVGVSFDDVWGQDKAKAKVMEQVKLLEDSDAVEASGGYMPKGLLLYGPPGTGKTYLAKAAAGYSSKPLILVPPGAFQATFVGINLLKVWMLFRHTRKLARRYGGVIVFIDEIDSLGSRGGEVDQGAVPERAPGCVQRFRPSEPRKMVIGTNQMGTLEAFLSAMDGMEEPRGLFNRMLVFCGFSPLKPYDYKYLMIGATNMLERLDPALLRAGRFGRKIHVTFPKVDGRQRTYEGYLAKVKNDLTLANIEWAARNHAKGTGAEIKDIVNEALLITYRDDRDEPGVVHFDDLMRAMIWVGMGESEGPFEREEAKWNVAVHEAGHAVAFHLLERERQHIWFASIEQRAGAGGMVVPTPLHEDWLLTRSEMLAEIQVSLASRVAEQMVIGETTNGHGGDGQHVTELAQKMVAYGHAKSIGIYAKDEDEVREQTEAILNEALASCRALLIPHIEGIKGVAQMLYDRGTVPGDDIHAYLDARVA